MLKKRNFFIIHAIFLAFVLLLTWFNYISINDLFSTKGLRIILIAIIELSLIYYFTSKLITSTKHFLSYLGILSYTLYSIVILFQCFSIYVSNNFISPMAIGNAETNNLINGFLLYIILGINLALIVLCNFFNLKNKIYKLGRTTHKKTILNYLYPSVLCLLYLVSIIGIGDFKESSIAKNQAPLSALFQAIYNYNHSDFYISKFLGKQHEYKKYFSKSIIFERPLPFNKTENIQSPNIIVFFMEGVSAQLLNSYGSQYPNLTPNLDKLADQSLLVTNYYNHTAATNRGIRGTLISGYQNLDDFYKKTQSHKNMQRPSLATILNKHHYFTEFYIPHPKHVTNMYPMLQSLGFQKIYYLENIRQEFFNGKLTLHPSHNVKDEDLMLAIEKELKAKERAINQQPFFIGVYNIGTHAFQNNLQHPYADGQNEVLNRIYNFDYQFGKFLTFFQQSSFANNTILIITADHATFPDPAYRKISNAQFFIDKIPLIIHAPFIDLPKTYDASGRNSIDFTPTLLHLLNINNEQNLFLGCSLFEQCKTQEFNISAMGFSFFITDKNNLYEEKKIPKIYKESFTKMKRKIYMYYTLDYDNEQ